MRHLYSPWRSSYIRTFKNEKKSKKCLFCRIAKEKKKDKQNLVVWRGEFCYVVLNKFPYNSGHLMIVPYRHTPDFQTFTKDEYEELMRVCARCMRALKKKSSPQGFNFGANVGRIAGAGIEDHIHFHVVPRWSGDTNFLPVLSDTKLISEDLVHLRDSLAGLLR